MDSIFASIVCSTSNFGSIPSTFFYVPKRNFDMICQQHLPFIADRVYTLRLSDYEETPEQINLFFSYIPSFIQFIQLRSLTINIIQSYPTLIKIINECQYLYNLTHLTLGSHDLRNYQFDFQLIIDNIWSLPKLRYFHFDVLVLEEQNFCTPTKVSSTLEYVNMRGYSLKWNQMNRLSEYTPRLKKLSICIESSDNDDYIPSPIPTIIDLHITIFCASDASRMISFLQNISNVRCLNINLSSNLIDGYQWEEVIRNYLPKLKEFGLDINKTFPLDQNMQQQVDQLIDSFRSSFWVDEHQWFVRCLAVKTTIHLYTLCNSCHFRGREFPNLWRSTYPYDNQQRFYHNLTKICNETYFDQPIPSDIRLRNIKYLFIKLPIHRRFWSIVPSLKRLFLLNISFHADNFQNQLQELLDRAPHLYCLRISQNESLPLQVSLFNYKNESIRELNLRKCNYWFNEEECMRLCHSPLGVQCQLLHIHVKNRECIIILVNNMINLRALHTQCEDEKFNKQSTSKENDKDDFRDENIENKDELVHWLTDRLPSTCLIVKDPKPNSLIRIWI